LLRAAVARAEEALHPVAHVLLVMAANTFVLDPAGQFAQVLFKFGAALRRVENATRGLTQPQQLGQRPRLIEHGAECIRPATADKIVRILALRQQRKAYRLARLD